MTSLDLFAALLKASFLVQFCYFLVWRGSLISSAKCPVIQNLGVSDSAESIDISEGWSEEWGV